LQAARELADVMLAEFGDPKGGFYDTGQGHEDLVLRPKDVVDNATPSGNAMAALALLRLGALLDEERYRQEAHRTLQLVGQAMGEQPLGFGHWLVALDWWLTPTMEFALVGEGPAVQPFVHEIYTPFLPNKIVAQAAPGEELQEAAGLIPLLRHREALDGEATAYLCRNLTCQRPVTDAAELAAQIEQALAR
ncbi:MAG: thioredoxin domain-containing protein, partial [Ardenticatenaceae bacterium]